MKKGLFAVGMLLILLVMPTRIMAESPFQDLVETDPHYEAVYTLYNESVISGYEVDGERLFKPNQPISRQHTAIMLVDLLGLETMNQQTVTYTDVSLDHIYYSEIQAVTNAGIFNGSHGVFHPVQSLTREQMASVLVRAFDLRETNDQTNIYLNNVSLSHRENVQRLADYQITTEVDDFRPKEPVTRGQFATFIIRVRKTLADEGNGSNDDETNDNREDNVSDEPPVIDTDSDAYLDQTATIEGVHRLVNDLRISEGKAPLILDEELSMVATVKSNDMYHNDYFSHTSPTYGSPGDLLDHYDVLYWGWGENIAYGYRTAQDVFTGWKNSEGHYLNMIGDYTHIGIGLSEDGYYWTQTFVKR